ncbi:MAG: hypothetical protein ACYC7E_07265 [Armatimonadota bacterium]
MLLRQPWRPLFFSLQLALLGIFILINHVNREQLSIAAEMTLNAQGHSATIGSLAGIIAAIVVIFLTLNNQTGHPTDDNKVEPIHTASKQAMKKAAIATFLCAFLIAILGAFSYASFAGFPEAWNGVTDGNFAVTATTSGKLPDLLFNLLGIFYYLAVYLCFYGLVLTVQYFTEDARLAVLTCFMVILTYMLGGSWVYLDFAAFRPESVNNIDFFSVGLKYAIAPSVMWLLPTWRSRSTRALNLNYWGLVCALVLTILLSFFYAFGACYDDTPSTQVMVDVWSGWVFDLLPIILSAIFMLFTYYLNHTVSSHFRRRLRRPRVCREAERSVTT